MNCNSKKLSPGTHSSVDTMERIRAILSVAELYELRLMTEKFA